MLLIISLVFLGGCQNSLDMKKINIGDQSLIVEVAQTQSDWAKGLGGRQSLSQNSGMLFIYPDLRQPGFWMKGMEFPLDMIWIKDNQIIDITQNIPVATTTPLKLYYPDQPVNKVLEVNAGWVKKNNIKIGDKIDFGKN